MRPNRYRIPIGSSAGRIFSTTSVAILCRDGRFFSSASKRDPLAFFSSACIQNRLPLWRFLEGQIDLEFGHQRFLLKLSVHELHQKVCILCQDGIFDVFVLRDLPDELQEAQ